MTNLSDLDQISMLKARYCRLADTKQWDAMAALLTDDAVMRFYDVGGALLNEVTAAGLARTIGERVGSGQPVHHLFSHEIDFTSETSASGV
ncbi:nuclear transport factor 2 family protein [Streptomyces sp. E5N91]|uniref:nuclear transport factor 2 family protein n=1 Tax=Streptomyces sp. E5N91 TaxID=1851996 RepID=UPI00187D3734|nr:nuclear transport factor 2 family protein [Streptomyces sp. E5N91]